MAVENYATRNSAIEQNEKQFVYEFLQTKGLNCDFITHILEHGLTDETIRQLECQGFSYEDVVVISKALKEESDVDNSCDCNFKSETETASRRSNQESDYLREHFGEILPKALREISSKKPFDSIEYLGHWLLHYRDCEERERRRRQWEAELLEERLKLQKPAEIPEPIGEYESTEEHENDNGIVEETNVFY